MLAELGIQRKKCNIEIYQMGVNQSTEKKANQTKRNQKQKNV